MKIKGLYGDEKALHNLIARGFDISIPRLLLMEEVRSRSSVTSNLVTLIYVGEQPPNKNWHQSAEEDFCRISNVLITSILFTGIVSSDQDWVHCVASFAQVSPLFGTGTKIYLEPPPNFEIETTYNPHRDAEMINVVVGWMHHNDAYLFFASDPAEAYGDR